VRELAEELERFIERDGLWDDDALERLADRLATGVEQDSLQADLTHVFTALRVRLGMGKVTTKLRRDVEAVVYPRLWKVIEALREDLPSGEQRIRIQVLNRRLARLFVDEDPRPGPGAEPGGMDGRDPATTLKNR
jgi:hypothetical protein